MDHINHSLPRTCPACTAEFKAQADARKASYDVAPVTEDFDTLFASIVSA